MTPAPIRYLVKSLTLVPIVACHQLTKLIPRDRKRVCIGAWFGNLYADNPKYFAEYLLENSDFEITWIGNCIVRDVLPKHAQIHFAKKGSLAAMWALLRAKFWVSCVSYPHDLTSLPIGGAAICIDLWHGIPVKRVGRITAMNENLRMSFIKRTLLALEEIYARIVSGEKEWLTVSSGEMAEIMFAGYPDNFPREQMLKVGTPRNDFLINNKMNQALRQRLKNKYASLLGFDPNRKIVLYLPTWRATGKNVFCFYKCSQSNQEYIKRLMDDQNAVLIEKHHLHTYELYKVPECNNCSVPLRNNIIHLVDTQELLLISDILISDYSSVYLDYALLERPIIHFVYDYAEYKSSDMGLYYDLNEVAGGSLVHTVDDLLGVIKERLQDQSFTPKHRMNELISYEKGRACEQVVAFMRQHS